MYKGLMRGQAPKNAKITEAGVARAKRMLLDGKSRKDVAKEIGVKVGVIQSLAAGHSFWYVQPADSAEDRAE